MSTGAQRALAYPRTAAFTGASVILPVVEETDSLATTVDVVLELSAADVSEIIIVDCERTTTEASAVIAGLAAAHPGLVRLHRQQLPFLGGALREAFDLARASHVIMMASDLETDPHDVPLLIAAAKESPDVIVTTSRWMAGGSFAGGSFGGYSRIKLVANWAFQKLFSALYRTHLTDMTYGYRIFPTKLVQAIAWKELRHPFLFETVLKPLRLGVAVVEIPTKWVARVEGESSNSFWRTFEYTRPGLQVRFARASKLLRPNPS